MINISMHLICFVNVFQISLVSTFMSNSSFRSLNSVVFEWTECLGLRAKTD